MIGVVLALGCTFLYYRYYKTKTTLDNEYKEKARHYENHNCIIIYSRIHGVSGWPGYEREITEISCHNTHDAFLPLLYFLNTTKETLDIAVMTLTSKTILNALFTLTKTGIKLRLIMNYDQMLKKRLIKEFLKNGADICIYAGKNMSNSIFHLKYAIKDYNTDFSAMCCGSLNWTNAAFLNNYENIVFTTNKTIIDEYYRNYESAFSYVKGCMEDNPFLPILDLLS